MLVSELCRFDNQLIFVSTKGSFATRKKDKAKFDLFATPSKILINTLFYSTTSFVKSEEWSYGAQEALFP